MKVLILTIIFGLTSGFPLNLQNPSSEFGLCEVLKLGIFEYPGQNDKYILCLFHAELVVLCPPNTVFDVAKESCESLSETTTTPAITPGPIPETTATIITETTTTDWSTTCLDGNIGFHPIAGTCIDYLYCFAGQSTLGSCPPGTIFVRTACALGNQATCTPM